MLATDIIPKLGIHTGIDPLTLATGSKNLFVNGSYVKHTTQWFSTWMVWLNSWHVTRVVGRAAAGLTCRGAALGKGMRGSHPEDTLLGEPIHYNGCVPNSSQYLSLDWHWLSCLVPPDAKRLWETAAHPNYPRNREFIVQRMLLWQNGSQLSIFWGGTFCNPSPLCLLYYLSSVFYSFLDTEQPQHIARWNDIIFVSCQSLCGFLHRIWLHIVQVLIILFWATTFLS